MNTLDLIHQASYDLTESERLEVFGYINMIQARFGRKKQATPINQSNSVSEKSDKSEQIYRLMCEIANDFKNNGNSIDMDDFEKLPQSTPFNP